MPASSSAVSVRSVVVCSTYSGHITAVGLAEWARPWKCPVSWVTMDWRSKSTLVSLTVKSLSALLSSMSAS